MKPRSVLAVLGIVSLALVGSCASTKWVKTWVAPGAADVAPMKKILVMGLAAQQATRVTFEQEIAAALRQADVDGVASSAVMGPEKLTEEVLRAVVREQGCDGLILTRIVKADVREEFVARPQNSLYLWDPYNGYSEWYDHSYGTGHVVPELTVRLQTQVWSATDNGKLVWTGISETVHPDSIESASRQLAVLVVGGLRRHKLI